MTFYVRFIRFPDFLTCAGTLRKYFSPSLSPFFSRARKPVYPVSRPTEETMKRVNAAFGLTKLQEGRA